jgi:cytoskeletal protein CcmA (bactofilin family)
MNDNAGSRFPSPAGASQTESLIDRESHFTGNYRTPHNLRIDGRYEGDIECRGTVFVGETAVVNARVLAGNVTVAGQFEGEIMCESRFEILRTGRVTGSVNTGVTVVHEGAFYQGELRMSRPEREQSRTPGPPAAAVADRPSTPPRPSSSVSPTIRTPLAAIERSTPPAPPAPRRRTPESPAPDSEPEMPASLAATSAGPRPGANGHAPAPGSES